MDLLLVGLFLCISFILMILSRVLDMRILLLFGAIGLIAVSVMDLVDGVDVQNGFNQTSSVDVNNVTSTNRTSVYKNYKNSHTDIFGIGLLLVGVFFLMVSFYDKL